MSRRNILIAVLVGLVILALWWFLFWRGSTATIDDIEADIQTASQEQETLEARIARLLELQRQQGQFDAAVAEISVSIPEDPSEAALLESIRSLARDSGLAIIQLTAIPPAESTLGEGLYEIALNLGIEGEYFRTLQFLFDLEDLDRLIRVDQLSISATLDEETSTNILQTNLTARAFSTSPLPGTLEVEEEGN
ncbi:MAG: type 4a pilus biogenesis protein PilO [Acidimicrobiia bacterium]|nr:type 4a pilus biogenesis protein PilO [Acidimicrobiia bacterium]MBT8250378.1 type 4a pilus biogenesis protein PilO [Acidimicrobiia bacterium]NNC43309.1 type 4a pilus biogenesis protein PilO [Acidimicrobiia bacterium]NND13630.1 type 4a pilus biogenesis protein PilO [Acidimicrobiia bacterium]NNL28542.1 type 4a pilus biogenesis protein PilO [Acidimicrobiia bacterium]